MTKLDEALEIARTNPTIAKFHIKILMNELMSESLHETESGYKAVNVFADKVKEL